MTFGPYIEHQRTNRQTGSKQVWSQVDRVPESCVAAYGIHQNDAVHAMVLFLDQKLQKTKVC